MKYLLTAWTLKWETREETPLARHCVITAKYRDARAPEFALGGGRWAAIASELGYANRSGAWKAARRAIANRAAKAAATHRHEHGVLA